MIVVAIGPMLPIYVRVLYTGVKRLKGSRVNREDYKGREDRKLKREMQHMAHLIKTTILRVKSKGQLVVAI